MIIAEIQGDRYDTIESNRCYVLYDPLTSTNHRLSGTASMTNIQTRDGNGFYLRGNYNLSRNGYFLLYTYTQRGENERIYNNAGEQGRVEMYFPNGRLKVHTANKAQYAFTIVQENSNYIIPTVSNVTNTSATIQWQDSSHSTAWVFRYANNEGDWVTQFVNTPSITLSQLEPATQYIYTIEGNDTSLQCMVPARHGFITSGLSDTLVMPYRSFDSVTIHPGNCYTIVDNGGSRRNYFHTDYSTMALRSANGAGFRIYGAVNLHDEDRIWIWDGQYMQSYGGYDNNIEFNCPSGYARIYFESTIDGNATGFVLHVQQLDTAIRDLTATNITANSATVSWHDNSGATQWVVHYGLAEDSIQTLTTTSPSAVLSNLNGGTQYIYWVTSNILVQDSCVMSDRKAFITSGVPSTYIYMPYRGVDTLYLSPNSCYTVWDAGGPDHNYFNNDTSELVVISTDGSDFNMTGLWRPMDSEHDMRCNSHDSRDRLYFGHDPNDRRSYYYDVDGYWNRAYKEEIVTSSENGFLRIRFVSNRKITRSGYWLSFNRDNGGVSNVTFSSVKSNSAKVTWDDNSGATSWILTYRPEGSTQMQTVTLSQRSYTMNNLTSNTLYNVSITSNTTASLCDVRTYVFHTLDANSIVMNSHSNDTVYIHPYQCYTVYDPGGAGDYLPSDTASLTIISTTGEGFYMYGYCEVGSTDMTDVVSIEPGYDFMQYWWENEHWCGDGVATFRIRTNEALQNIGFAMKITFYPSIYNPDTLHMTDSSVTIVWQDTSAATQWTFSYGPDMDSMQSITVNTRSATMTGLRRNQEYFYCIENNVNYQHCVFPSIYSVIMPCDTGLMLTQYRNYYLARCNRDPLYGAWDYYLDASNCYHAKDHGANNRLFYHCDGGSSFHSINGTGVSLRGFYDLGENSMYIDAQRTSSWYSGSGYLNVYNPNGYISVSLSTGKPESYFGPGFDFEVRISYPIYNVSSSNVTCNSARLSWDDSSSATQWSIAYGPSENALDTVVVSTKYCQLNNLLPDHQYICYISNNRGTACYDPVKYAFITTCDTHIIIMPYLVDTTRVIDIGSCYIIHDPGGPCEYFYNDQCTIHIKSSTGDKFVLRGWVDMTDNDYLYIIDDTTGTWYNIIDNKVDNLEIHTESGAIRLEFHSAGDTVIAGGFEFNISFNAITNIKTSLMTDTTCRVTWSDHSTGSDWVFWYGTDGEHFDSIQCHTRSVHLNNLVDGTIYYVYITNNAIECIDTTWFDFCAGGEDCIDFANLYDCHTNCRYGRVTSPDETKGVVDYGYDNIYSRHTVVTDTAARDPHTGNQLRCIPTGHDMAVRLGNWDIGGEAESITYEYIVDTNNADILLLRYAAVMENPNHQPADQPRFRFAIVDENDNEIDPDCYAVDFVASSNLGWNEYLYDTTPVLWKDWTAVGMDLETLQGQRIFVKLTTYDCAEMGHFAYAYFTIECSHKYLRAGSCSEVTENNFELPEGFTYSWFNVDSMNVVLSTSRNFSSNLTGVYVGRSSFMGSMTNNCYFDKVAIVGSIYPYARYTYDVIDTVGCRVTVQFHNHSLVTTDSLHENMTQMDCENFLWIFGDGDSSYAQHPTHIFGPGSYDVRLLAFIGSDSCVDDTVMRILMPSPCIQYDTVVHVMCDGDTLRVRDSVYTIMGNYVQTTEYSPDSIWQTFIYLTVNPSYDTSFVAGICDGNPYTQYGFNDSIQGDYVRSYHTVNGCDSIYRIHLQVATRYDTTVAVSVCDNVGYPLGDSIVLVNTTLIDSLTSIYGCDSVLTVHLTIKPTFNATHQQTLCMGDSIAFGNAYYDVTGTYVDSLLTVDACDSIETLTLTINQTYSVYDTVLFCQGDQYNYRGQFYAQPTDIYDSLQTVLHCDSIVHIHLQYYDSTFAARWLLSLDSIDWFSADTILEGCEPLTVYMKNRSKGASGVVWILGDGNIAYEDSLVHQYDSGLYTLLLIASSNDGCSDTMLLLNAINVFKNPVADFMWDPDVPPSNAPRIHFINLSQPDDDRIRYTWYFQRDPDNDESFDTSIVKNPDYEWEHEMVDPQGEYYVRLITLYDNIGLRGDTIVCTDTIQKDLTITSILLQFPNVVTPNGDGINDRWVIVNLLEFGNYPVNRATIYNRWGAKVYEKNNISEPDEFWDPNDCNCPDGTYYFRFKGLGPYGEVDRKGVIEVLR